MAKNCCICKAPIEKEDAPVLAIGAYGTPKCICEDCENKIDRATTSRNADEIENAIRELGETLTKGNTFDDQIIENVNGIIKGSAERLEKIKNGTYDFAEDEVEEPEFELEEDMLESEEDKALDEKDAKVNKIVDTVTSWVCGIAFAAALIFFLIKFVF